MNGLPKKIAFIHDWLVEKGGAENVLAAMLELWPNAPVYTLFHDPSGPTHSSVSGHEVIPSFLQKIPGASKNYRAYLPLMPLAIEQFDLSEFDLIISNSYAVAKGVLTGPNQLHICMCCSPIRYAWDLQHQYLQQSKNNKGLKIWEGHESFDPSQDSFYKKMLHMANESFWEKKFEKIQ